MPVLRSALAGTKTLQSQGQRLETGAEESLIIPQRASLKAPFAHWGNKVLLRAAARRAAKETLGCLADSI